jgi:Uma2 family endonuclease
MATRSRALNPPLTDYPTGDGKPLAETPVHRDLLLDLVHQLIRWYEADPMAYASGNMMMYYVEGDKRRHVSPDVFVTLGIPVDGRVRDAYFVWVEGKGPDFVIELTSKSTRREDQKTKLELYRDVLKVREYFLFDPYGSYLKPPLKGFRLVEGAYEPILAVDGRLPSEVTGLHLDPLGQELRLYNPATGRHLPRFQDFLSALDQTKATLGQTQVRLDQTQATLGQTQVRLDQTQATLGQTQARLDQTQAERDAAKAEAERLRLEVEALRRRLADGSF